MSRRNVIIVTTILLLLTITYNLSYRILITNLISPDNVTLTIKEYSDRGIRVEVEDKEALLKQMKNGIVLPSISSSTGWSNGKYFLVIEVERDGKWIANISTAYEMLGVRDYYKSKTFSMNFNYALHTYIQELYIEERCK